MSANTLLAVIDVPPKPMGPGFEVAGVRAEHLGRPLDPFLAADAFAMAEPFFPPHPHAGFSAVTYMLPESPGGFVNRDSRGDRSLIRPGGLHWTEAARGMMHEETPIDRGVVARGLQIFVNLPLTEKLAEPRVYHAEPDEIAEVGLPGGARLRLLAGGFGEWCGAVRPRTPCALFDLDLPPGGAVDLPLPEGWRGFGLQLGGRLAGFAAPAMVGVLRFDDAAGRLALEAGPEGARVVLFAGPPLGEPVVFGGPFAMGSIEQLQDAKRRFGLGEMGQLSPSFRIVPRSPP